MDLWHDGSMLRLAWSIGSWWAVGVLVSSCTQAGGDDAGLDAHRVGLDAVVEDAGVVAADDAASVGEIDANRDAGARAEPACAGSPQPTRLRIVNACDEPIWIERSDNVPDAPNVRLGPGECHDVPIPDAALASTRFWAKTGCAPDGTDCAIGQSVAPCPAGGCHPPIESKLEVTWADPIACPASGAPADCVTWYNASQVDGYTLPFRIVPNGPGADEPGCVVSDCGALDLAECPSDEDLSEGGAYPELAHVDLRVFDPRDPSRVIGCMAPCKRLNYPAPWGLGAPETTSPTVDFCCPTPPITPEACTAGPVARTDYVTRLQTMCPSVYSYAYDDADGLHTCPAQTRFELRFCP
jgi:hypothetical protein